MVVATVVVVITNLLLDLVVAALDPKVRTVMSVLPLDAADEVATEPVPPAQRRRGLPYFLRRPGGIFGAAWLIFIVVASLTAPLWVPYDVDRAGPGQPARAAVGRSTGSAPTRWAATCSAGSSPPAPSRCWPRR